MCVRGGYRFPRTSVLKGISIIRAPTCSIFFISGLKLSLAMIAAPLSLWVEFVPALRGLFWAHGAVIVAFLLCFRAPDRGRCRPAPCLSQLFHVFPGCMICRPHPVVPVSECPCIFVLRPCRRHSLAVGEVSFPIFYSYISGFVTVSLCLRYLFVCFWRSLDNSC